MLEQYWCYIIDRTQPKNITSFGDINVIFQIPVTIDDLESKKDPVIEGKGLATQSVMLGNSYF